MAKSTSGTFATKLQALRETAGLSQYRLAQLSGVTKQTISRLELGEAQPSWDTVQALARGLGVEVGSFVIRTDAPEPPPVKPKGRPAGAASARGKRATKRGGLDRRKRPSHSKGVIGDRRGAKEGVG